MLPQHRECIGLLDPRVVGDLVVADEGRVDHRNALDDVAEQRGHVEVAHDHGDRAPHPRVEAPAVDVLLTAPALAARRQALDDDVPEVESDRAREAIGIGEVGEILLGSRALTVPDHAHRRRTARRIPREHVAAAGSTRGEETATVGVPPLELGGVLPVVRDHRAARLLLVPAKGRHVVVAPQQQPRLAGAGLGREIAFPGNDPVAAVLEPPGHGRGVALAEGPAQDGLGEPIDLEQDHARDLGAVLLADPTGPPPHDPQLARVIVEAQRRRQQHQADREHDRRHDRSEEGRRGAVDQLDR